jgi:multicomponent Na+:H+ antiporter subunit E
VTNVNNVNGLLWNILLALAWAAVTGTFSVGNLLVGFAIGFGILFLVRRIAGIPNYFIEVRQVAMLLGFLLWELVLANLKVAWDIVTPRFHMRPGVIAVPLEARTDTEITLLANLITLTPGSMALDISSDRKVLYLHAMYVDDPEKLIEGIKEGFEARLLDVLR